MTVVDSQIAEKSLMERLGERKQVIYSVEDLATEFDLRLKNDYTIQVQQNFWFTAWYIQVSLAYCHVCLRWVSSFSQKRLWEFSTSTTF